MTADLWATDELPGLAWDPEPDDEDNGPYCRHHDLWGFGLNAAQLWTMTDVNLTGSYL